MQRLLRRLRRVVGPRFGTPIYSRGRPQGRLCVSFLQQTGSDGESQRTAFVRQPADISGAQRSGYPLPSGLRRCGCGPQRRAGGPRQGRIRRRARPADPVQSRTFAGRPPAGTSGVGKPLPGAAYAASVAGRRRLDRAPARVLRPDPTAPPLPGLRGGKPAAALYERGLFCRTQSGSAAGWRARARNGAGPGRRLGLRARVHGHPARRYGPARRYSGYFSRGLRPARASGVFWRHAGGHAPV